MNIKTEVNGSVGIATLNRPEALNALNTALLNELAEALEAWNHGTEVRCMIVTGSERAFAAGADIKEMAPASKSPSSRRWRAMLWAAAANWRWSAISSSLPTPPNSASPKLPWASCPAWAAASG
jgi:enoyl-CoA hydratase/carnithine racemase